jgi:hypothetical membrane protein
MPHTNRSLLLTLGAVAGPLYLLTGLAQALTREGFDMRRHALSVLSNGEFGWIQTGNFLLAGVLVLAGAVGCRAVLRSQPGGTWGPILLAVFGVGLIGAGIFPADPAPGFPPGSPAATSLSTDGLLHFVFGALGFYGLIAACFVFARRFRRQHDTGMFWYSVLTGLGFFASFAAIASGSMSAAIMIGFYVAVAWIWVWHTIVLLQLGARVGSHGSS